MNVFLTGSTDGIGRETAAELARRGARVLLHGRSADKLAKVAAELRAIHADAVLGTVAFDLADLGAVRAGAAEVAALGPLDVLLLNAGVFQTQREVTKDGFEKTFAVNHLANVVLVHALVGSLRKGGRIVQVSSMAHQRGGLDLDDLQSARRYDGYAAYALSKLANVLFTVELSRCLPELATSSLHPGVVTTKLLTTGFGMDGPDSLAEGSRTSVFLALSDEGGKARGGYYVRERLATPNKVASDDAKVRTFYERSCELVGETPLARAAR